MDSYTKQSMVEALATLWKLSAHMKKLDDSSTVYALAEGIVALEKQIPLLVADTWEVNMHINGECKICGEILRDSSRYCSNCGQRAKWKMR